MDTVNGTNILHILNGDCALDGWHQAGFAGEVLVWRENYLLGTLPENCTMTEFNRIRAEVLHNCAPEKTVEEIFDGLQEMHRKISSLKSGDKVILWLDCCPFDQALKHELLKLLQALPERPQIFTVQKDVVWNRAAFLEYRNFEEYLWQ